MVATRVTLNVLREQVTRLEAEVVTQVSRLDAEVVVSFEANTSLSNQVAKAFLMLARCKT